MCCAKIGENFKERESNAVAEMEGRGGGGI